MDLGWHFRTGMARSALALLKATGWFDGFYGQWRGALFEYAQEKGIHVLPVHFYSPVPDTRRLPDSLWSGCSEAPGLELDLDAAVGRLEELAPFAAELEANLDASLGDPSCFRFDNPAYGPADANVLYGMVRRWKPRTILELGAGNTTLLIAQALRANGAEHAGGPACEFVSVDPYPPSYLSPPPPELTRLQADTAQSLPLERFTELGAGDLLFIDSSHVVAIGSDVVYLILQVLPRLAPGVIVHIHDIFIPAEYPKEWTTGSRFFWNEQYLVQAFLAFNSAFDVLLPLHAIQQLRPGTFERLFSSCRPLGLPGSALWLRRRNVS